MVRPQDFCCIEMCYKIGKVGKTELGLQISGYSRDQNLKSTVNCGLDRIRSDKTGDQRASLTALH